MSPVEGGASGFSVARRLQNGVLVIVIRGELDADTAPVLTADLEAAANWGGAVVVDLCGASYMDSSGLYALMVLRRRLAERSRALGVACWPEGAVAMAFRVSGTDELFDLYRTRTDAVDALRD